MPRYQLISHHLCPYVQRAVIVLSEKGIAHDRRYVDLANKPDWFVKMSPLGRVPILQADEAIVFESQVIAEYLNEITDGSLHPTNALEKARHRSWIEYGSNTLNAIGAFYAAKSAPDFEDKRLQLAAKFQRIEKEVAGPFFDGSRFHMVDAVWGTVFRYIDVFDRIGDFGLVTDLAKLSNWRGVILNRPSVAQAVPDDYSARLLAFLKNKNSHISSVIQFPV